MSLFENIVILTGAGISAESGLSTFRGDGGLWEGMRVEDVATAEAFRDNPDVVQSFYNQRRKNLKTVKPNTAHKALARLEREHKGEVTVITQNVDNLHEQAGSKNVLHMHGELLKAHCRSCKEIYDWKGDLSEGQECPGCRAKPSLRPHIVFFNEMPFFMDEIEVLVYSADLFISIGTSGSVYPAAGFVSMVKSLGQGHTVELNLEPSEGQSLFAETIYGKATKIVPDFVENLLKEKP
ncbi:MAG: NAD-dependent deacylase [Sphingomonadales bacterium]